MGETVWGQQGQLLLQQLLSLQGPHPTVATVVTAQYSENTYLCTRQHTFLGHWRSHLFGAMCITTAQIRYQGCTLCMQIREHIVSWP